MKRPRITIFFLATILLVAWCPMIFAQDNDDRKASEKRSEKELQSIDKKIDSLKSRAARAKGDARKDYDAMMKDLQEKRDNAGKKLQELKQAGLEKWEQAKAEFNSALQDLKEAYERSVSRMRKNPEKDDNQ